MDEQKRVITVRSYSPYILLAHFSKDTGDKSRERVGRCLLDKKAKIPDILKYDEYKNTSKNNDDTHSSTQREDNLSLFQSTLSIKRQRHEWGRNPPKSSILSTDRWARYSTFKYASNDVDTPMFSLINKI